MSLQPVLIDARPGYLGQSGGGSLLCMPFAAGSLLAHLRERMAELAPAAAGDPVILAPFEHHDRQYAAELAAADPGGRFAVARSLAELAERCESSDWLLLADAARFPFSLRPRDVQRATRDPRCVTHFLAQTEEDAQAEERLNLDSQGRIVRIQRYYEGVTRIRPAKPSCTLLSVAALQNARTGRFRSLGRLRRRLAEAAVPAWDVHADFGSLDLTDEAGLLALNELALMHAGWPGGDELGLAGVRVGRGCRIHRAAQIVEPVVIQDGAWIDAGAAVIGPAVIGRDCRIGADAVVAQCVLGPGAVVEPGSAVHHRVVAPGDTSGPRPRGQRPPIDWRVPAERERSPRRKPDYASVKRCADACAAALALIVLAPVMAVIAILIKLDSRGPVLYGDQREGEGGRVFRCWKFRSMVPNASAMQRAMYRENQVDGPQFKMENDRRVTRVGALLRKTNLDELPQFFNVLVGEMSLIGPRPSPFRENQICVPWRKARLSVRPGITGLWQVCRHDRSYGDFHQWIHYDMLYVRHMSAALDFRILVATFLTLGGKTSMPLSWVLPEAPQRPVAAPVSRRIPILQARAAEGGASASVGAAPAAAAI